MVSRGAALYRDCAIMLDRILLSRFRNHRDTALEGTAKFNLLIGENGAGKTNVLEAISLFAPGRGLRRAALADMPGYAVDGDAETGGFAVSADLVSGAGSVRSGSVRPDSVRLGTGVTADRPGRRVVHVNQAEAPALRLAEWLAIGWLTPAMDRLFAEGAGARRRFLDRLVLAVEPGHAKAASRLEAALRERNRLLSEPAEPDARWLDAIEAQIAEAGSLVATARAALVARMQAALDLLPDAPFARPALHYEPGGPLEADGLAAALAASRRRDRAAQRTLVGPHRDELAVTMAGKGAGRGQPAAECSTGEQKAMLIAITLAHADLLDRQRPSLLLLDEVAAHLDPVRRAALFDRLRSGPAQLWLTGTELAPFAAIVGEAAIWRVSDGAAERLG